MSFIKKLATADDKKEFKEKFGVYPLEGDCFVVNSERDCLLHSPRQDRWDMGGTTNTYWDFTYQNKNHVVACGIGRIREEKEVYYIPIVSVKEDDYKTEITAVDDNFIANFSDAYNTYKKFNDTEPEIERESLITFKFNFAEGFSVS